jgi:DNA repair exonuclease SbcCD nuclease subunit
MKIAILGDTHLGVRNDSSAFHDYYESFYKNQFFPFLKENDINTVIQLGDLFDRRKYINFNTLHKSKRYFFDKLQELNVQFHTLLGNHDIFWKESLEVNSSSLILGEYSSVYVHDKPTTLTFPGCTVDIIPWICAENYDEVTEFISKSNSLVCMGHFEIAGFAMYKGADSQEGLDRSTFKKYQLVLSGHYHTRSHQDNIIYTGTPYEMTWQDCNDPRGFHVLDTETLKTTFYENEYKMFVRREYSDDMDIEKVEYSEFTDKQVKIIVTNKNDAAKFDKYITRVYNSDPHDVKIIEDLSTFTEGRVDENINLEDTLSVMSNYIDSVASDVDKEKVKNYMKTLYTEAVNAQST